MTQRARRIGVALIALAVVAAAWEPSAAAATQRPFGPVRKLGRGLANVALGVLEVPFRIGVVYEDHGVGAAAFWGSLAGIQAAVARIVVGAVEVVTFPLPLPRVGYGPIVEPEFLLNPKEPVETTGSV
ncbi:MAG: exosortase system-associated protein, TIGR04073 family [Candidatus Omnitrophica bacterium]|nr:exosortase system-associated protein, TIGR04073 family [Candidatus Omnitrophota bacterium]